MNKIFYISLLLILPLTIFSQTTRIGQWRSHLNYTEGIRSEEVKDKIYCATENGLFFYNKSDNTLNKLSKIDGFSDISISTMKYDPANDILMIAYTNTMVDILKGNTVWSIDDIHRKAIPGKKIIYSINFNDNKAYISSSFGIVVYDIKRDEIKETYAEIGSQGKQIEVYSSAILKDSIFAATDEGLFTAPLNSPNLLDYKSWIKIKTDTCHKIVTFQNKLYTDLDGYIYEYADGKWQTFIDSLQSSCKGIENSNNHLVLLLDKWIYVFDKNYTLTTYQENSAKSALIDKEGDLWLTLPFYSLLKKTSTGYMFLSPNGPASKQAWDLEVFDNVLYVASGGLNFTGGPTYNSHGIYYFKDDAWTNKSIQNTGSFKNWWDFVSVAVNPISKHLFIGSYGFGVAEYNDGTIIKRWDKSNSSLEGNAEDTNRVNVRCLKFDNSNNLWVTNFGAAKPLSVQYANGSWKSFSLGSGTNRNVGNFIIDDYGRKWILLPLDPGIVVFDETRAAGNQYKKLVKGEGNGNLPTDVIHSIAKDLDGKIWIGSEEGIAVFYNPSDIFGTSKVDAQKIWISDGNESGYLLSSEIVTAIAVDGANNKWIGSRNGVWYVNEDGTKIIYRFNTKNSPLPSDYIQDISINQKTGEVYFATDNGIVSFRNTATLATEKHEDVYAFPNPVKPGYDGNITVHGLVRDAIVKITDVTGNVVTELRSEGGQAIWNGADLNGNKVTSGVYLVFSSDEDGIETAITKILIVR